VPPARVEPLSEGTCQGRELLDDIWAQHRRLTLVQIAIFSSGKPPDQIFLSLLPSQNPQRETVGQEDVRKNMEQPYSVSL